MNVTKIVNKCLDNSKAKIQEKIKTTADIANNAPEVITEVEKYVKKECNNDTQKASDLTKIANRVIKAGDLKEVKLKKLSSSEIKERKEVQKQATKVFAKGVANYATMQNIFEVTINNEKLKGRTSTAIITGLCSDVAEEKKVIDAINKSNDGSVQDKEWLTKWYNTKLKDFSKEIKQFKYEKTDKEIVDFANKHFTACVALAEFQGETTKQVATLMGITIEPNIVNDMKESSKFLVDIGISVETKLGNLANPLYPEIDEQDFEKLDSIFEYGKSEGLLTEEESEIIDKHSFPNTERGYDFAPYNEETLNKVNQVFINARLQTAYIDAKLKESETNLEIERETREMKKNNASLEEIDAMAKEKRDEVNTTNKNNKEAVHTKIAEKLDLYVDDMITSRNAKKDDVNYRLNGEEVDRAKAMKAAIDGLRVQAYKPGTENQQGQYLFTLSASQNGYILPKNPGKPLSWDFDKSFSDAEKTKGSLSQKEDAFKKNVQGALKENLSTMYDSLKKGSRFWISSKGEYGQLMNQIKDAMNSDLTNKEDIARRVNEIKNTANDYFMNRLNKKDKSDLANQREEAVEKVLQSFGSDFDKEFAKVNDKLDRYQERTNEGRKLNEAKKNIDELTDDELMEQIKNDSSAIDKTDELEKKQMSNIQKEFKKDKPVITPPSSEV